MADELTLAFTLPGRDADVMGRGTRLLMFGMAKTLYRLSITFKADAAFGTRVTVTGQAKDETREAILREADEHGSARAG